MVKRMKEWGGDRNSHDANYVELVKTLSAYSEELNNIVNAAMFLHWKGTGEPGINVFNGGNVRMFDDLWLYQYVKAYVDGGGYLGYLYGGNFSRGGTRKYSQSHPTIDVPYEVTMPAGWVSGWGCFLFGTHNAGTWFQTEATSVKRGYGSMGYHTVKDFVAYKMSGKQQGPVGTSDRSDSNPILVDKYTCNEARNFFAF